MQKSMKSEKSWLKSISWSGNFFISHPWSRAFITSYNFEAMSRKYDFNHGEKLLSSGSCRSSYSWLRTQNHSRQ